MSENLKRWEAVKAFDEGIKIQYSLPYSNWINIENFQDFFGVENIKIFRLAPQQNYRPYTEEEIIKILKLNGEGCIHYCLKKDERIKYSFDYVGWNRNMEFYLLDCNYDSFSLNDALENVLHLDGSPFGMLVEE